MADRPKLPEVSLNPISEQLEIEYPARWLYKVIGSDETELRNAVMEAIDADEVSIERSNTSSSGKYVSLNVEVVVDSQAQRTGFYDALRDHPAVRMVL